MLLHPCFLKQQALYQNCISFFKAYIFFPEFSSNLFLHIFQSLKHIVHIQCYKLVTQLSDTTQSDFTKNNGKIDTILG